MTPQYKWGKQPLRSHVKLKLFTTKTKMPGASKLPSLLKISIGQKNQLFIGNIFATLDFLFLADFQISYTYKKVIAPKV